MSVTVVSTGPEATAGSAPSRLSSSGTVPPTDTATSVLSASAPATTTPRGTLPFHSHAATPRSRPRAMPFSTPTFASCHQTRSASRGPTTPKVSSRMLTATAWFPEQPLMSDTMGRNTARAITAANVSSNAAMTLTEIMFSTMLMESQERRLPERAPSGMLRGSSPATMPRDLRWSSAACSTRASSTCARSTTPSRAPASSVTGSDNTSASSKQASTVARSACAFTAVGRRIRRAKGAFGGAAIRSRVRAMPTNVPFSTT